MLTSTTSLECPVCWTIYRDPKVLPACGHSVCGACVARLVNDSRNRRSASCPECRQVSHLPPRSNSFPTNYRLADLVEQLAKSGLVACSSCRRKTPKADLFTCTSCDAQDEEDVVVCGTCAIRAHKEHALESYVRATQRDIEEARRTLEEHQAKAVMKGEEMINLLDKFVELTDKVLHEELSELDMQQALMDAGTKDELTDIVQASAQTLAKTEGAVSAVKVALSGLIRQLEGESNDDIMNNAFEDNNNEDDLAATSGRDSSPFPDELTIWNMFD